MKITTLLEPQKQPLKVKIIRGLGKFCTTKKASGSDLLSHTVTNAVPSALEGLTSVFGMGTGVAPPPLPPESLYTLFTP